MNTTHPNFDKKYQLLTLLLLWKTENCKIFCFFVLRTKEYWIYLYFDWYLCFISFCFDCCCCLLCAKQKNKKFHSFQFFITTVTSTTDIFCQSLDVLYSFCNIQWKLILCFLFFGVYHYCSLCKTTKQKCKFFNYNTQRHLKILLDKAWSPL